MDFQVSSTWSAVVQSPMVDDLPRVFPDCVIEKVEYDPYGLTARVYFRDIQRGAQTTKEGVLGGKRDVPGREAVREAGCV